MIACVAVVGKQNNPLFLRSFNSQTDALKFHFIVHTALDLFEERGRETAAASYLGLLFPTEEFKVYGHQSNTGLKLVAVLSDSDIRDSDMKAFFERLQAALVRALCNPFQRLGSEISSQRFQEDVARLVASNC